jgi:acetolactate synthase-1/2/3 large subunit
MFLNDAVALHAELNGVPCHHEQACGIAAEAYGRTSECGVGVAIVTTGPGATNVITPVAGAWIESLPLIIISGQVKRPDALNGRPLRQGGVQEVDIVPLVKSITKYAATVSSPSDIERCFDEALWHMRDGRPGPVWLDIPLDVQAAPMDYVGGAKSDPDGGAHPSNLVEGIAKLMSALKESKRPLILVGHGVRISGGGGAFQEIVEKFEIPCVFTWNASDLLPWNHPQYVGRPGVVAARAPNFAIQNCDLLIAVGCRLDNIVTAYNPKDFARNAKKIVVDVDPHELSKFDFDVGETVCADASVFLTAWCECSLDPSQWSDWRRKCQEWKSSYPPLDGRTFTKDEPTSHFQFVDKLSDVMPERRLVVTGSSGLAVEVFYTAFRNKVGQRMMLTSGLGSMGYGLPAAIGACLGGGRCPTVCVESDGSLMLNLQELATLRSLNLPIILLVMNNQGYASIRNTQMNYFEGRYLASGQASGLFIPNVVSVAASFGLNAHRLGSLEDLSAVFEQEGPVVVDVPLCEDEALSPKVSALPQPDGTMLSMPLEDMSPLLPRSVLLKEMLNGLHPTSVNVKA